MLQRTTHKPRVESEPKFLPPFSGKKGGRERLRRCRNGFNSEAGRPQAVTEVNEEQKATFKCRDLVLGADDDVIYLVLTTSYYRVFGNNIKPIGRLNHI